MTKHVPSWEDVPTVKETVRAVMELWGRHYAVTNIRVGEPWVFHVRFSGVSAWRDRTHIYGRVVHCNLAHHDPGGTVVVQSNCQLLVHKPMMGDASYVVAWGGADIISGCPPLSVAEAMALSPPKAKPNPKKKKSLLSTAPTEKEIRVDYATEDRASTRTWKISDPWIYEVIYQGKTRLAAGRVVTLPSSRPHARRADAVIVVLHVPRGEYQQEQALITRSEFEVRPLSIAEVIALEGDES